jgi:ferric-dicitrate binding protein FerR (iron transport regulator)
MLIWVDRIVSKISPNSARNVTLLTRWAALAALCGSCAYAQTEKAAKVIVLNGQVSVIRGSGSLPWALNEGDLIEPSQRVITGPSGFATLRVLDGSTIDVYPNSQFVFRANPGELKDMVDMILGKIKVKIEHFGSVPNHNTVRTPTAVIAVRGTIFDVDVNDTDETTVVLCEEGRVEVTHLSMPGKSRVLEPGESVTVFKNQPLAKNSVDRGAMAQKIFRAASDALNEILYRRSAGSAGTAASTTSTSSGDKGGAPAPTGPAAPPPPPHN